MKCQIQMRGGWDGVSGTWTPVPVPVAPGKNVCTFASWDEAEDVLDQMQLAGVLPLDLDVAGVELRIINIDDAPASRGRACA
jgi:hypothetical protein